MMWQAIGQVLPAAAGVALSPIPVIAITVMLGTQKARSNGPAFALGWIAGLAVTSTIVLVVANGASDPDSTASTGVDWLQVAIGLLFLGMARRRWAGRPGAGAEPAMPEWMSKVDTFSPGRSLVLGAALSGINPKCLALTVAAMAATAQAGLETSETAVVVAVYVLLGSLTVLGPVIWYLVATDRAATALTSLKQFMTDHNAVIMMVVLVLLGVMFLGRGLGATAG